MACDRVSLYVGDLHPEVTEDDIVETFSKVGPLVSVRLCRDKFTHSSLCYAYVNFYYPPHAQAALSCLNHTMLRGKSMRIMWCERDPITRKNNRANLFVKNLVPSITSARLHKIFSKYGIILSCKVAEENGISRGFGFVQFETEAAALEARNALHDNELEGKKLYVSKFLKRTERSVTEPHFRNLYVKHLDDSITEDFLKAKFEEYGKVRSTAIMKDKKGKTKGFGFVEFDSHEAAKKAMEALNGELIGSKNLFVGRAQKKAERKVILRQIYGDKYKYHHKDSKGSDLYVKNLDASVDDIKLQKLFNAHGKVTSAHVARHGDGFSRGFGFVHFSNPDEAKKALNSLNGTDFQGRTLYVALAKQKNQQISELQKPNAKFPLLPLYASSPQPPLCNFGQFWSDNQLNPFHPTFYQNFGGAFNSFYPFIAQSFQDVLYASVHLEQKLVGNLDASGQSKRVGIREDKKSSSRLHTKIIEGSGKEFCEGSCTVKTISMRSSQEIQKTKPGHLQFWQPLFAASGTGVQLAMATPNTLRIS